MTIRSAAKAVILRDNRILLQHCVDTGLGLDYYELPGGGQLPQESLYDALRRECLEETGYSVRVLRLFALSEEIITVESVKRDFPHHAHRMFHIFLCEIEDVPHQSHTEEDVHQVTMEWLPIEDVAKLRLRPLNLAAAIPHLLACGEAQWLGTSWLHDFRHIGGATP